MLSSYVEHFTEFNYTECVNKPRKSEYSKFVLITFAPFC